MKHVEHEIQALLDRRLPDEEAARVREHCRGCESCRRILRRSEAVLAALEARRAPALGASVWPEVQARIGGGGRRRPVTPLARLGLVGGGLAAMAAGLVLGLWLQPGAGEGEGEITLLDQGAVWVEDSGRTLDQIYVAMGSTGEE